MKSKHQHSLKKKEVERPLIYPTDSQVEVVVPVTDRILLYG
ncbi:MAG: hypothetical protein P4M11_09055 [Candidatus Pacebacteria bacterium]|nr:hypothetical protein [Candidatus Paceibacterota bacterium]